MFNRASLSNPKLQIVLVVIFFTLATIPMFYPISFNMGSMVTDRYDGLLQTWMMIWDIHAWKTGASFWDANMFWPHPDALAYSDHMIGAAIVAAPFYLITGNPIFAHNAFTFLSFVIGGVGMFLLARRLTGSAAAGLIAGIIFAYCPWRLAHVGAEINQLANQWMPFALLFLHRALDDDSKWWEPFALGIFIALHSLGSFYHAAMIGVMIISIVASRLAISRGRFSKRTWLGLIVGGLTSFLLILPASIPYYRVAQSQGTKRNLTEIKLLSADVVDYLRAAPWNRLWGGVSRFLPEPQSRFYAEHMLFIGFTVLVLAIIGAHGARNNANKKSYIVAALVLFIFSLGPYLNIFGKATNIPLPYLAAYHLLPGFGAMRGIGRFAVAVETALAVLAAFGFVRLMENRKTNRGKTAFTAAIISLLFLEFFSSPLPNYKPQAGAAIPEVYKWLADQKGQFPIIELPQMPDFSWLPEEIQQAGDPIGFRYEYFSMYHWKNLINGHSSFNPPTNEKLIQLLVDFPSPELIDILRYHGAKYLILHSGDYYWDTAEQRSRRVAETDRLLKRAAEFGPDIVYGIPAPVPDDERRQWWKDIAIADHFAPEAVKPGSKFNLEVKLTGLKDAMPVYSFELVGFKAAGQILGSAGAFETSTRYRDFVMINPLDRQWAVFTFQAPDKEGDYEWNMTISIGGNGEFQKEVRFKQKVGKYPDSTAPGVLKASFLELEVPAVVNAGEKFSIKAIVRNDGDTLWRSRRYQGDESYKGVVLFTIWDWQNEKGQNLELFKNPPNCPRGFLEEPVPPGGAAIVEIEPTAPQRPGKYKIVIEMVSEWVTWFDLSGGEKIIREIEVK